MLLENKESGLEKRNFLFLLLRCYEGDDDRLQLRFHESQLFTYLVSFLSKPQLTKISALGLTHKDCFYKASILTMHQMAEVDIR